MKKMNRFDEVPTGMLIFFSTLILVGATMARPNIVFKNNYTLMVVGLLISFVGLVGVAWLFR